jgi:hypothetical protein
MLYPLIGVRLHGWLDDLVALTYIAGAWLIGLEGVGLSLALFGAAVHFLLTRLTDYPQGTWRLIPFARHAYIELAEGIAILVGTLAWLPTAPVSTRIFLTLMGASQLIAFAFSDYGTGRAAAKP